MMDTQEMIVPKIVLPKIADGAVKSKSLTKSLPNSWRIMQLGIVCRNTDLINPEPFQKNHLLI